MKDKASIPMPGPDINPPGPIMPPWPQYQQDPRIEMAVTLLRTVSELLEQMRRPIPQYYPMDENADQPEL